MATIPRQFIVSTDDIMSGTTNRIVKRGDVLFSDVVASDSNSEALLMLGAQYKTVIEGAIKKGAVLIVVAMQEDDEEEEE